MDRIEKGIGRVLFGKGTMIIDFDYYDVRNSNYHHQISQYSLFLVLICNEEYRNDGNE